MFPTTSSGKTRKRSYRQRILCTQCEKQIDSDYKDKHISTIHGGKTVTFVQVHEKSQRTLSSFFEKPCTSLDHETSDDSTSDEDVLEEAVPTGSLQSDMMGSGPNQPVLNTYRPQKFGKDIYPRDFKREWFQLYPWLSYDIQKSQASCYPCNIYMNNDSFTYSNWKKVHRLAKHAKGFQHKEAMVRWLDHRANVKQNSSVLGQLNADHQQKVAQNRAYLRVIIETLLFTAKQNIPQRGHAEDRSNLSEASDINRGNFLEILHLRSKDIPWFGEKLKKQLDAHMQWTSPRIQNEILDIMSDVVLNTIAEDVKKSFGYSIIVDETSDISRWEQVAICLRFTIDGETRESFVGFYSTPLTDGQALYNLVTGVMATLNLELDKIVGQCYDGAANMSGVQKGLASRMKDCSPRSVYVHCYGHLLNLAIQDTMADIEPMRNALGVIQSLYNFLEASPKRHAVFFSTTVGQEHPLRTLKSQSVTRWSCRYEAVKSVIEQLPHIVETLLRLSDDRDPKTYADSTALLNAIADFNFLFGLIILRIILSNTNSLHNYLQGKTIAARNDDRKKYLC